MAVYLTETTLAQRNNAHFNLLDQYFGTLDRSILTIFQSISGGYDWSEPVEPLIQHVSPWMGVVYSLFVAFVLLALMNVITGVFVEQAVRQGKEDKDSYTV